MESMKNFEYSFSLKRFSYIDIIMKFFLRENEEKEEEKETKESLVLQVLQVISIIFFKMEKQWYLIYLDNK